MSAPGPVPHAAIEFLRAKRLHPTFDYRELWKQQHLRAFTVAKAMHEDVLASIRDALVDALEEGQTFAQFKKDLQPTLEKLGWWGRKTMVDPLTKEERKVQVGSPRRLRVIYDTNMRVARAQGQWQRIQSTKELRPYLRYELGPSEHHRPEHVAWEGTTLPVDDPFWETAFPPNGWGCKCHVIQLGDAEVARTGGVTARPQFQRESWLNERTGQRLDTVKGIDPGWDYNPGQNPDKSGEAGAP